MLPEGANHSLPQYDEAPELAPHYLPEVHHPPMAPEFAGFGHQNTPLTPAGIKTQDSMLHHGTSSSYSGGYPGGYSHSAYGGVLHTAESTDGQHKKRLICGCTVVVFILSTIIAILSVAVIGLAAGTGVEASRANGAEAKLAVLGTGASTTATAPTATSTTDLYNSLDRNCTSDPGTVSGTTYTTSFYNKTQYQIFCNSDAPNDKIMSLFVGNFDDCMDACAFYSYYTPDDFNSSGTNTTCAGVSFIPLWTNRTTAIAGAAPGNCYLKPGPQSRTNLTTPNVGTECHAAILI